MSSKVFWFTLLISFIVSIVMHNPPGVRCQYQKECVPIRLF